MCLVPVAPACGTICVCDMTHSYVMHYTTSHVSCTSSSCVWHNVCVWHDSFICDTLLVHVYVCFWCAVCHLCRLVWCVAVNTHYSVALYMFLMCSTDVQYITCAVCCSGNTLQCCTVCVSDMQCITCVVCCSEHTLQCCTVYVSDVQYWCAVHHLCRLPVASVWDMTSLI